MELKEAEYRIRNSTASVAYIVRDQKIYFTGTERNGSTINRAEDIIRSICKKEGIKNPTSYVFYDVQTNTGYFGHEPGYYEIDRLDVILSGSSIRVVAWEPVVSSRLRSKAYKEVLEAFKRYIV